MFLCTSKWFHRCGAGTSWSMMLQLPSHLGCYPTCSSQDNHLQSKEFLNNASTQLEINEQRGRNRTCVSPNGSSIRMELVHVIATGSNLSGGSIVIQHQPSQTGDAAARRPCVPVTIKSTMEG